MSVDWNAVRAQFPALSTCTYLNSATYGQLARRTVEAVNAHFTRRDGRACADFLEWFDDMDRIRESCARLVNCKGEDIAFILAANTGLSLLIGGIDWKPGDRIVTLENEFPNHLYYPQHLASRGVEFVETPFIGFYDAITPATRLVAISSVSYSTGFRPPLEEIGRFLRERGVLFYLDGTQSLGALKMDIAAIQPDLMAANGYKWMLTPNGAGFMYVSPALRQRLEPAVLGWRSHWDWRNVNQLHTGAPEFSPNAEKYEGGMLNFPSIYAMGAAVDMVLELGVETVDARVTELAEKTRAVLRNAGGKLAADEAPHYDAPIVTARFEKREAGALAKALKERNVLVSARHGNLRVSPHFYNDESDLEVLAQALAAELAL